MHYKKFIIRNSYKLNLIKRAFILSILALGLFQHFHSHTEPRPFTTSKSAIEGENGIIGRNDSLNHYVNYTSKYD